MSQLDELLKRLDSHKLARLGAALWFKVGSQIRVADLSWALALVGENGDRLLWEALMEASVIGTDEILEPKSLVSFLDMLCLNKKSLQDNYPRLVWTLPSQHPQAEVLGGTYVEAILTVIHSAQNHILLISPFLQEKGVNSLREALAGALARGVRLTILTHDADNLASSQSMALEDLRKEAERLGKSITVYTTITPVGSMLHAKIVIADGLQMVLGSANLTESGLCQNIEAGVVLGEKESVEINAVVEGLIKGGLVRPVFTT